MFTSFLPLQDMESRSPASTRLSFGLYLRLRQRAKGYDARTPLAFDSDCEANTTDVAAQPARMAHLTKAARHAADAAKSFSRAREEARLAAQLATEDSDYEVKARASLAQSFGAEGVSLAARFVSVTSADRPPVSDTQAYDTPCADGLTAPPSRPRHPMRRNRWDSKASLSTTDIRYRHSKVRTDRQVPGTNASRHKAEQVAFWVEKGRWPQRFS